MERISARTRKLTLMGMMLAITLILSIVENMMPPIPFLPPNTKLGLSNVIIMYTLFFLGTKYALALSVLKSLFVITTRGLIAGLMSFCGGLLAVTLMAILLLVFKSNISYMLLSVFGAIGHNIGQMIGASLQMQLNLVTYYWPFLLIAGVFFGIITGIVLQLLIPSFNRLAGINPLNSQCGECKNEEL